MKQILTTFTLFLIAGVGILNAQHNISFSIHKFKEKSIDKIKVSITNNNNYDIGTANGIWFPFMSYGYRKAPISNLVFTIYQGDDNIKKVSEKTPITTKLEDSSGNRLARFTTIKAGETFTDTLQLWNQEPWFDVIFYGHKPLGKINAIRADLLLVGGYLDANGNKQPIEINLSASQSFNETKPKIY